MSIRPSEAVSELPGRPARPSSAARQHQTRVRHHNTKVIGLLVDRIEKHEKQDDRSGTTMKQMLGFIAAGDRVGRGS
jgi:hypothetical protein